MKYFYVLLFSLILLALIFFAVQNDQLVQLRFLGFESVPLPLFSVIYIGAFFVVILMAFLGVTERFRLKSETRKFKKEAKTLKAELEKFKSAPAAPNKKVASLPAEKDAGKKEAQPKAKKFSFKKSKPEEEKQAPDKAEKTKK
jgi:uncharacterized integral membrane protein